MLVEEPHSRMTPPARANVAGGFGVMVVDVDLKTGSSQDLGKFADPGGMLAIDQDQAGNPGQVDILHSGEIQEVAGGLEEEVAHALLLRTGENHGASG